jgi:hypothetical protein
VYSFLSEIFPVLATWLIRRLFMCKYQPKSELTVLPTLFKFNQFVQDRVKLTIYGASYVPRSLSQGIMSSCYVGLLDEYSSSFFHFSRESHLDEVFAPYEI